MSVWGQLPLPPTPSLCPVLLASLLVLSVSMVRGEHRDCLRMAGRILLDSLVTSLSVTDGSWGESDFCDWTERHSTFLTSEDQCVSAGKKQGSVPCDE